MYSRIHVRQGQIKGLNMYLGVINIYHSNIQGQMGANDKDLQDNYILIDDFTLILELIVFLLWVFPKSILMVFCLATFRLLWQI